MSYLLGMGVSFYFNKTFTFRNKSSKVHFQFASFSIIAFTQYLLTLGLMFVFVDMVFNNPDSNPSSWSRRSSSLSSASCTLSR